MGTLKWTRGNIWPAVMAVGLHGILLLFLILVTEPRSTRALTANIDAKEATWFTLQPLPEGGAMLYMAVGGAGDVLPLGAGDLALGFEGEADLPGGSGDDPLDDAELEELLAADREALRAELEKMTQLARAEPLPRVGGPMPTAGKTGASRKGPEGAIRELNLDGFPQKVVDDIMDRYGLEVVMQTVKAGRQGQNFLSSASSGGDQYFGGMAVPAGVYEVFQLRRDTVALMSRLEEAALREQGFEPMQARVIRIVFGIVKSKQGGYELGVKSLEAEKVAP